jgi:hypothetical protein
LFISHYQAVNNNNNNNNNSLFMHGIYPYIPATTHVSREYSVAAIL